MPLNAMSRVIPVTRPLAFCACLMLLPVAVPGQDLPASLANSGGSDFVPGLDGSGELSRPQRLRQPCRPCPGAQRPKVRRAL